MEFKSKLHKTLEEVKDVYCHEYDVKHVLFSSDNIEEVKNRLSHAAYFLNHTVSAIYILELDRKVIMANKGADHLTALKRPFKGLAFELLVPVDFSQPYYRKIWETALDLGFWQGQISYINKENEKVYQWMKIFRLLDHHGKPTEMGIMLFDMSESVQMLQDINRVSFYDLMTNLPNWRRFNRDIENDIQQASEDNISYVILVRLSNLSEINVLYNNEIGDQLIFKVIDRIQELLLPRCTLYRVVGDVFAIFASDVRDVNHFNEQIRKIKRALREPFYIKDNSLDLVTAFGVSLFPKDATQHKALINCAEIALNLAKNSREDICFYSRSTNDQYIRSLEITDRLKSAIENDLMDVYYQPILNASTQQIVAVEGLLRWNDPELGYISPEEILQLAETRNYLFDLEFWVIKHIFKTMPQQDFCIFINVSLKLIEHPDFVSRLMNLVSTYHVNPDNIVFEITEHHAIQNSNTALSVINKLCEAGFKMALDDFGVGYSSVSLLIQFPIHIVKLDRSFIAGLIHDEKHRTVVKSIANMVKSLNMKSVCEGIETEHHAEFASLLGVDYLQGYYHSKPLSYNDLMKYLASHKVSSKGIKD